MKLFRHPGILLFIALFLTTAANAADFKVGIVDFDRVLKESKGGKTAKAEIEAKGKSVKAKLEKKEKELTKLKDKLEAELLVMSEDKRENKERDFRIKVNDFKMLKKREAKEFKRFETEVIQRIQKEVFELVGNLGKKGGYDLIVERSMALYHKDSLDITSELIKAYDQRK